MMGFFKRKNKPLQETKIVVVTDDIESLKAARDAMRAAAVKNAESQGHLEDLMNNALQRITNNG